MTTIFVLTAVLLGGTDAPAESNQAQYVAKHVELQSETGSSLIQPNSVTRPVSYTVNLEATCAAPAPNCGCDAEPSCEAPAACDSCSTGCDTCGSSCGCNTGCNAGCNTCGTNGCGPCGGCNGCGCGYGHHFSLHGKHCLPSTSILHGPGNMTPHLPYTSYPKTYYYFRPYNMIHIPNQQALAAEWVENIQLPYSNSVFSEVYAELEPELNN